MPSVYNQKNVYDPTQAAESPDLRTLATNTLTRGMTGYKPSDDVQRSYNAWITNQQNKPADYTSTYTTQLDNLLNQVMNRPKFSYDVNQDELYKQARDQYMLNGRQAMKDTIGQASAMTGGYGNSYAASAGNQAYQQYLTQLASMMPEFYDRAFNAYNAEGDRLTQQYGMLSNRENQDYSRYRDTVSDWRQDVDNLMKTYSLLHSNDYGQWSDNMANAFSMMGMLEDQRQADRDYELKQEQLGLQKQQYQDSRSDTERERATNIALQLLSSGQMPDANTLSQAGISTEDARAFIAAWNAAHPAPVVAAASSGSSNSSKKPKATTTTSKTGLNIGKILEGVGGLASNIWNSVSSVVNPIKNNKYGSIT